MKSRILAAFGIAGALACGAASATTYFCTKDPADVTSLSCVEAPRDDRAYGPAAQQPAVPSSAIVAYSLMVAGALRDSAGDRTAGARLESPPPSLADYRALPGGGRGS